MGKYRVRRYWYRSVLIMITAFTITAGGGFYLIQSQNQRLKQEVNASPAEKTMVIPGGMPVGIYLETEGALVLGTAGIKGIDGNNYEPSAHLIKEGDYIVGMNDKAVRSKADLMEGLQGLEQEQVVLKVRRKEECLEIKTKAVLCTAGEYKLGIWVRDNAQGLGTITFLTTDSRFGALGHGIHDVDTNELLDISEGTLYATSIKDIQKGESGTPGGMEGIIVYNNYNILGTIGKNTESGIYGDIRRIDALFGDQTPVEAARKEEIRQGDAVIRCSIDGKVKEYKIKITKIDTNAKEVNKGLEIKVVDEELLEQTGGIVQGMSGSPILQEGKLVGAVTHVFVNHPAKGYGIFAESMLENM